MRILVGVAAACLILASPALSQEANRLHRHGHAWRNSQSEQPAWREAAGPTERWSQYYGRSYSDGDLWTPNSANGG